MRDRPAITSASALILGLVLAVGGASTAGAAPEPGTESPLSVTFPAAGSRVSGGDVTFRGSVRLGEASEDATTLVQYVVDVSGSTTSPLQDCNGDGVRDSLDDFNGDGRLGDVLDCEISAVVALNASLRGTPASATRLRVGVTGFGSTAAAAQMERDDPTALFVPPGLTGQDREVVPNVNFVASSLRQGSIGEYAPHAVGTGTNFDAALDAALTAFGSHSGPRWVFFLSDGQATVDRSTLDRVTASGVTVRTFAVGNGTGSSPCGATAPLGQIAAAGSDGCVRVLDPSALTASVAESRPEWVRSVTVEVDGQVVEAEVDPIGGWTASARGLATGSHIATVTASLADGDTWSTVVPFRVANQVSYVALGDSYASGEGISPYLNGTNDYLCHRSRTAWPTLVAAGGSDVPLSQRDDAVFRFIACSGARIVNLDTVPQVKKTTAGGERTVPLQLDQLSPDADLVTLSIGGNDLGFAPIVTHCFSTLSCPEHGFITTSSGTDVSLDDWTTVRLALIGNELTGAYDAVRARVSPDTTIVATTYPRLVSPDLLPGDFGYWVCYAPALSQGERQWLRGQIDTFAAVVRERARRSARVQVVDVRDDFEGRNVCDRDSHFFGPTMLRPTDLEIGVLSAASFHPTDRGARLYAAAVNDALADRFDLTPVSAANDTTARSGSTLEDVASASTLAVAPSAAYPVEQTRATAAEPEVATDPDAVLERFPPDVVAAVGSTTFADVVLGNGAGMDGHPSCDDVVEREVLPLLALGFAPGSVVAAETVTRGWDGTEHGRSTSEHHADEDGVVRSSLVAPAIESAGMLVVSLRGQNSGGGPVVGTAIASTSADSACRATVGDAGRIAPAPEPDEPETPGGTGAAAPTAGAGAVVEAAAADATAGGLSSTGLAALRAVVALVVLGGGGVIAVVVARRRAASTHERPSE